MQPKRDAARTGTWTRRVVRVRRAVTGVAALAVTLGAGGPGAAPALGDCTPSQTAKITAWDGVAGDSFGSAVAIDGDTLLVSAPWDDSDAGADTGAVYVYARTSDGWSFTEKWSASDAAPGDQFGKLLVLSGDLALVGAPLADLPGAANAGAAYAYTRVGGTWSQTAKLTASDASAGDQFATSLALSGSTALIGATWDDQGSATNCGSAYVFKLESGSWTQQARLLAASPAGSDFFGWSVALEGNTALIGAMQSDVAGSNAGAVYAFTETGGSWAQTQVLTALDAGEGDNLGYSLAMWGGRAVVGAWSDDEIAANAGAVYVFARAGDTWFEEIKLVASDGALGDNLGGSVAVIDEVILAGARGVDLPGASNAGATYVFVVSGSSWTQAAKITSADPGPGDSLGICALYDTTAVAGAAGKAGTTGAAYVFHAACACVSCDTNCDGSVNGSDIQLFRDALEHDVGQMCSPCMGDSNRDGTINGLDIEGFVECLTKP